MKDRGTDGTLDSHPVFYLHHPRGVLYQGHIRQGRGMTMG